MDFASDNRAEITEFDLQALVDGEFDIPTHARMMSHVVQNSQSLRRLEELYHQKELLKKWWRSLPDA